MAAPLHWFRKEKTTTKREREKGERDARRYATKVLIGNGGVPLY
jgi:hypothetical protein